jgi:hypothetical protein
MNMVIVAWNLLQVSHQERNPIFQIICMGIVAYTILTTLNRRMHHNGAAAIVQFLNCMVNFQRSITEGNSKLK